MCSNRLSYSGIFRTLQTVIPVLRVQIYGKFFIPAKLFVKKIKKFYLCTMKNMTQIAVTLLFLLIYGVSQAQINFSEISHNFGEIAEDGGVKSHNFHFRNTSDKPVVIVSTHASCGCTKTEFSRKPIMPDSVGVIKVSFNPMNYPGAFARKITVITADGALKEPLLITGRVIPRKKSVEEEYPIVMGGGVRVAANAHSFGYLEHGKMKQSTFDLVNTSPKRVAIRIENRYPELEFYYPETVAPNERVSINFVALLPEDSKVYGSLAYSINLVVDGKLSQYPFVINALAIDSREENANNRDQMIVISEKSVKFGAVKCAHAKHTREIDVVNSGDSPLAIRKIEISGDGFKASLQGDSVIEAGGKRALKVEIDPSRLPYGAVVERLRIVSNDPKMPVLTIRVSAIVES